MVLAIAAGLVLNALRDSIVFFSTPQMVAEKQIPVGKRFRLGGMVEQGSLVRGDNLAVSFKVSDGGATLPVNYKGILPDLFREGQGVVAEGAMDASGVFKAIRSWRSMTRTTCRRKSLTRSRNRGAGRKARAASP